MCLCFSRVSFSAVSLCFSCVSVSAMFLCFSRMSLCFTRRAESQVSVQMWTTYSRVKTYNVEHSSKSASLHHSSTLISLITPALLDWPRHWPHVHVMLTTRPCHAYHMSSWPHVTLTTCPRHVHVTVNTIIRVSLRSHGHLARQARGAGTVSDKGGQRFLDKIRREAPKIFFLNLPLALRIPCVSVCLYNNFQPWHFGINSSSRMPRVWQVFQ